MRFISVDRDPKVSARVDILDSSINPEERLKIREQQRDFESEKFLLANKVYAEHVLAYRLNAIGNVREYGTLSIRTLFLLNGGAILALLSFVANLVSKSDERQVLIGISIAHNLRPAFYFFTSGVVLAGILAGIAYLNWGAVFRSWESPSHLFDLIDTGQSEALDQKESVFADRTVYLAIGVAFICLICFAAGAYFVAEAMHVLGA